MSWMSTTLTLTAILLVTLQGLNLFSRAKQDSREQQDSHPDLPAQREIWRLAGTINLCLATGSLIAFFLFRAGVLIASPEYGVLLVQGTAARAWACLVLLGASIVGGIIWQIARRAQDLPGHRYVLLVLGIAIGSLAAYEFQNLNPYDPAPFCIRFYDMWWPPLLVWLVICFSQWTATTAGVKDLMRQILWGTFCVTGLGLLAIVRIHNRFQYGDPSSQLLWKAIVCAGVPLFMALSPLVLLKLENGEYAFDRRIRVMISGLAALVGLASVWIWIYHSQTSLPWFVKPWLFWIAWTFIFTARTALRLRTGLTSLPQLSARGRRGDAWAGFALVIIACSLADLVHFIWLDPAWDLAALIFSWVVLLEMIACAKIVDPFLGPVIIKAGTAIKSLWKSDGGAAKLRSGVLELCRAMIKVESWVGFAVRVLVAALVLVAVAEIPYAGKTIVHPFNISDLPNSEKDKNKDSEKDKNKYLERALADRVANTLSLIGQDLRPDVLVAVSPRRDSHPIDHGDERRVTWVSATSEDNDGLEAAARSSLSIPGLQSSVPMEFFTAPIQGPMRSLLGIRTIRGSIQIDAEKNNRHVLLATSSNGQTWRAQLEYEPSSNERANGCGDASDRPKRLSEELQLADMLAYQIASSDPILARRGGTSSWRALEPFHEGMVAWNTFELTTDYDALKASIRAFREAACEDPSFAMAQYRLGRALTSDGQPGTAVEAYRASLQAYPDFVAGHIALASTLSDFNHYSYYPPPAVLGNTGSSQAATSVTVTNAETDNQNKYSDNSQWREHARQLEARTLWRHVIQEPDGEVSIADRAAAYAGLCQSIMSEEQNGLQNSLGDPYQDQNRHSRSARQKHTDLVLPPYAAFFYCKRAEYLYSQLPPALRGDGQIKAARSSALNQIGKILDGTPLPDDNRVRSSGENRGKPDHQRLWLCDDEERIHKPVPYMQYALKYYERALAVLPEDLDARCNFAIDSWLQGKPQPMVDLNLDPYMHIKTGDRLWAQANYKSAIDEYQKAVDLSPTNTEAMNDYANAFWEWRLASPDSEPSDQIARQAEYFARQAMEMTKSTGTTNRLIIAATLVEVLLGKGKPLEALEVLKKREDELPDHAYFNDVRWDLAQAYVCVSNIPGIQRQLHDWSQPQARAEKLLNKIRELEATREWRPFSDAPATLNLSPNRICQWAQPGGSPEMLRRSLARSEGVNKNASTTQVSFKKGD